MMGSWLEGMARMDSSTAMRSTPGGDADVEGEEEEEEGGEEGETRR